MVVLDVEDGTVSVEPTGKVVDRAELPRFADRLASDLRAFEAGRPFSPARYGHDWGLTLKPVDGVGGGAFVRADFKPLTPGGVVYLAELRAAGFFET